jgi:hypothetical protein
MKRLVGLAAVLGVTLGLFGGGSSALAARTLAPPTADFGNQQIGTTSAPKGFVLTATCQAPVPINPALCQAPEIVQTEPTTAGNFTIVQNTCPAVIITTPTVAPVVCAITVAFKPTAIGPFVGTLKVGGLTSTLSGTGTPAPVVTPPATPNTPALPPTTNPAPKKKKKCGKRKGQKANGSAVTSAKGKRCGKRK